jgi:hypothetical protein
MLDDSLAVAGEREGLGVGALGSPGRIQPALMGDADLGHHVVVLGDRYPVAVDDHEAKAGVLEVQVDGVEPAWACCISATSNPAEPATSPRRARRRRYQQR